MSIESCSWYAVDISNVDIPLGPKNDVLICKVFSFQMVILFLHTPDEDRVNPDLHSQLQLLLQTMSPEIVPTATIAGDASILREYLTKHPHEVAIYARCAILPILPEYIIRILSATTISLVATTISLGPVFDCLQHCFYILQVIKSPGKVWEGG